VYLLRARASLQVRDASVRVAERVPLDLVPTVFRRVPALLRGHAACVRLSVAGASTSRARIEGPARAGGYRVGASHGVWGHLAHVEQWRVEFCARLSNFLFPRLPEVPR
jgi:hypothetical protein